MAQKQIIASAYFASDKVIYAVRNDRSSKGFSIGRKDSAEQVKPNASGNMKTDLDTALKGIRELMAEDEILRAVVLICPGPFATIDKNDHDNYGKIGHNAEVENWRGKNAKAMFRGLLVDLLGQDVGERPIIYIYNQAGATAVGEFMHLHGQTIRAAKDKSDLLQKLGSHLFVVADSSIDAALITRGEPYHGLSTMNVGHHAIYPKEDLESLPDVKCKAHPQRPCLNSLASLNAIKKRWPGTYYADFKASDDVEKLSLIAFYIAQMLANVTLTTTPTRIVIGGRIRDNPYMIPYIRQHFGKLLNDVEHHEVYPGYAEIKDTETFIIEQDDPDSGVKGGLHVLNRILVKDFDRENVAHFNNYVAPFFPA